MGKVKEGRGGEWGEEFGVIPVTARRSIIRTTERFIVETLLETLVERENRKREREREKAQRRQARYDLQQRSSMPGGIARSVPQRIISLLSSRILRT